MASTRFLFPTSMLLLSLLVIASASDYGSYAPKPNYEKPKPQDKPAQPTAPEGYAPKPNYETPKPEVKPALPTKPYYEKPTVPEGYVPKPNYETPKPEVKPALPTKPYYEKPNPEGKDVLLPTIIGIQGLVLCKSGSKYFPLKGALARITCVGVDEKGYETAPFSILSNPCDANGYFFATLSYQKVKECKAFLDYSPLDTCKVPTDVNHGTSGGVLSSYRILNDKHTKLYSVGPFFYTSETQSVPNNGY